MTVRTGRRWQWALQARLAFRFHWERLYRGLLALELSGGGAGCGSGCGPHPV